MGFTRIPEEAEKRCNELSGKEWKLATLYFRYADKTGTAWPSLDTIAKERAWTKSNACKARQGLIQKGWLRILEGDKVQVIVGFIDFQNGNAGFQNGNAGFQNGNETVSKMEISYKEEHDQHELDQLTRPEEQTSELSRDARPHTVGGAAGQVLSRRHPALQSIQQLTGYLPNKALWAELVEVLGDMPDYPRLEECFRAWTRRGYRPVNFGWVLDWYVRGVPQESRPQSHSPPGEAASDARFLTRNTQHNQAAIEEAKRRMRERMNDGS